MTTTLEKTLSAFYLLNSLNSVRMKSTATSRKLFSLKALTKPAFVLPLEMNACLPGCVWNATPRSLSPLERNIGFWTQA